MERRHSGEASQYGFTLIELLIVIVVLGILAAIVVFSLTGVTGQSKQLPRAPRTGSRWRSPPTRTRPRPGAYPGTHRSPRGRTYLHSWPGTGNGYTFSLGTDTVQVAIGTGAAAATTPTLDGLPSSL